MHMALLLQLIIAHILVDFLFQTKKLVKKKNKHAASSIHLYIHCLLYTSPSPRDRQKSRMPSSA